MQNFVRRPRHRKTWPTNCERVVGGKKDWHLGFTIGTMVPWPSSSISNYEGWKMNRIGKALKAIEANLKRAEEQRTKIRKRVDAGVAHESHLAYADGLVAGLESARALVLEPERIPEGDCRDIPV
jgi:hypothetical protein